MREVLGNFQWRVRAFALLLLDSIAMGSHRSLHFGYRVSLYFQISERMYYGLYMSICRSML